MTSKRIVHLAMAFAVAALFSSGFQTASLADMTVTQEITTTVGDSKTTFTQAIYCTKTKMKSADPSGMVIIIDLEKKAFTILNPKEKSYMEQTLQDMKEAEAGLPAEIREMKLSVRETGEKKTIDGYPCEKLVFKAGEMDIAVWMTKKITFDAAVTEFDKKFLELTKDIKALNIQARMRGEFEKRKGYPYLTIIEIPLPLAGKTQRMESKVKKVSYERIDASVFEVPAGYKPMAIPGMPPGR